MFEANEYVDEMKVKFLNKSLMSCRNSYETVEPFSYIPRSNVQREDPVDRYTRSYEYISYESALVNLDNHFPIHLNEKKFLDTDDNLTKEFNDIITEEISEYLTSGSIFEVRLRGRKTKSFTAWVSLEDGEGSWEIDESFLSKTCKVNEIKVTAMTLVSSDDVRKLRISLDEDGARLYEIINGSFKIAFHWRVNDKDCCITANIDSDGTVSFTGASADFSREDIMGNRFVKIKIGNNKNKIMTFLELFTHTS
ncbi:uncharacterized protein TNIN_307081 [Trichonephila inaurata madagascariensis]|uniref:Uncharacterized protein n=1 Tax=Trichonephila inaurata madagascariensis TaxID=2747483 RepID=A0A8X6JY24_9ARAC|nr:uncharacterized protein TNIN_307081 [Trichonephila inaurata madagascariensis]